MSRYFQQLARHAGLAPSGPAGASLPAPARPAPQADVAEEITERDSVPSPAGAFTAAAPQADLPGPPASAPPVEFTFPSPAQPLEKTSLPETPEKNPAPSRSIPAARETKKSSIPGRQPIETPSAAPDAATVIQQVLAWVAEPERARAAPSTDRTALASAKNISPAFSPLAPAEKVPPAASQPAVSQPATIQISPAVQKDAVRKDAARPAPAPGPDKKNPRPDQAEPIRLELVASPTPTPQLRPRSGQAPAAIPPRPADASPELNVSIGSIHLTVEAPPPAATPPARPPRAAATPAPPARTIGGLPTRARRHYLRSFT